MPLTWPRLASTGSCGLHAQNTSLQYVHGHYDTFSSIVRSFGRGVNSVGWTWYIIAALVQRLIIHNFWGTSVGQGTKHKLLNSWCVSRRPDSRHDYSQWAHVIGRLGCGSHSWWSDDVGVLSWIIWVYFELSWLLFVVRTAFNHVSL